MPQAAIALKQGFGRLIRSRTDRGVLSLLDNRITKTRYGQIFFDSLPDYAFTTKREDVEKFFDARLIPLHYCRGSGETVDDGYAFIHGAATMREWMFVSKRSKNV